MTTENIGPCDCCGSSSSTSSDTSSSETSSSETTTTGTTEEPEGCCGLSAESFLTIEVTGECGCPNPSGETIGYTEQLFVNEGPGWQVGVQGCGDGFLQMRCHNGGLQFRYMIVDVFGEPLYTTDWLDPVSVNCNGSVVFSIETSGWCNSEGTSGTFTVTIQIGGGFAALEWNDVEKLWV